MTLIEIKKELYKQKPIATFDKIRKSVAYYSTVLTPQLVVVNFEIPVADMGDADFTFDMPAQLLNRWIIEPEQNEKSND
jgi:hypothetical protein